MVARVATVAYAGLDASPVDVQVQLTSGLVSFVVVGLPDKAVRESRDRVTSAFASLGLAMPPKKIIVNLAPADLEKAGSHYDLPIALGLLCAMGILDAEQLSEYVAVGELSLDGRITASSGVLLAAMHARSTGKGLICPVSQGTEANWVADRHMPILAAPDLHALVNHFKGQPLPAPESKQLKVKPFYGPDMSDIRGQETPKRAMEIAAAGGHSLLMNGPPGAGKSMMAAALPGILPPLSSAEALEVAMIASVNGPLEGGQIPQTRPMRSPHHSASMAALIGGGAKAKPGEVSLAHHGVLFLDELPEFQRNVLDALRQPLERGEVELARAALHVTYPARVQLIAAMNPCRCGHLADAELACSKAPQCAGDYQSRISGPLMDRIDLFVDIAPVKVSDLALPADGERSAIIAARVAQARHVQASRYRSIGLQTNAQADNKLLDTDALLDNSARDLLLKAVEKLKLSARAWTRLLRVARTIADLDGSEKTQRHHMAEALSFRRRTPQT